MGRTPPNKVRKQPLARRVSTITLSKKPDGCQSAWKIDQAGSKLHAAPHPMDAMRRRSQVFSLNGSHLAGRSVRCSDGRINSYRPQVPLMHQLARMEGQSQSVVQAYNAVIEVLESQKEPPTRQSGQKEPSPSIDRLASASR